MQVSAMMIEQQKTIAKFRDLNLGVEFHEDHISCGTLTITNDFLGRIKEKQLEDSSLRNIMELLGINQAMDFELGAHGILRFKGGLCIRR